ncbi:MAG: zinc ribbon domain-containing protein [Lachnospiraceae bacterium]|nr:zinc ribbon domain-containing protein [Lachnospiraceae bacterium]MBP3458940.1 zinc ribbon domain-containing protein [Lachnospiraceae bacterium]
MNYIPVIIILVLLLTIILAIFCGISYVKHKTKELSRTIFGTESLSAGAQQMKREYATTPKSVSAMTSLLLPKIVSDFPDFQYDEMKERAENLLTQYLRAVTQRNAAILTDGNTELKQQLDNHIQMLSVQDLQEHFDQIKIHRTEINQYRKTDGRCIITFQSALECYHYITEPSSAIKEGSRDYKYQTKYNTDLIYIQDRNLVENELDNALGVNCPNCGAPLSSLGAKKCEYCGTPVIEINIHAWSFSNVEEIR